MRRLTVFICVCCCSFFGTAAFALAARPLTPKSDEFTLGDPHFGGNGCGEANVRKVQSPDKRTASLLFDKYSVAAGNPSKRKNERRNCNISMKVHLPTGTTASVYQIDYRGFAAVPAGGSVVFAAKYFLGEKQRPTSSRTFTGPFADNFLISDTVQADTWAPCGKDTELRANTDLIVESNNALEQATANIDSADIVGSIEYHWAFNTC